MRDFIDRPTAAALLGLTVHYMEKHRGRPGFPKLTRYGRKVWYRRKEIEAWRDKLAGEGGGRVKNGRSNTPDPSDDEIALAAGEAPFSDPCPEVTAMLAIARKLGTHGSPEVTWPAGVDEWPSGLYDTPHGVLIRRKT